MADVKEYIGRKSIEAVNYDGNGHDLCNMWLTEEEIIRCRDCKYMDDFGDCTNPVWQVAYGEGHPSVSPEIGCDNGFCAWAERDE